MRGKKMTDYIIKDIQQVAGYLPAGILCGLAAVAIYLIYVKWIQKNERRETAGTGAHLRNSLIWFLLAVYMTFMFITVFLSREPGSRQGIDMKLFGTWGETPQAHAFVIENILLLCHLEYCTLRRFRRGEAHPKPVFEIVLINRILLGMDLYLHRRLT